MKGLLYYGKDELKFSNEIPRPKITHPEEVLIKVHWCGICGTDLLEYVKGPVFFDKVGPHGHPISGIRLPQTMGHELSGEIVEIGSDVAKIRSDLNIGDNVVCEPTNYCKDKKRWPESDSSLRALKTGTSECEACRLGLTNLCEDNGLFGLGVHNGGLAEYIVVAAHHIVKVPSFVPLDCAALVQPLSVSYHAFRVNDFKEGSSALIIGAGAIGLGCILAANAFDASKVVCSEPAKIRREQAEKFGVTPFNPMDYRSNEEAIRELKKLSPGGSGFDYAFDCSGLPITFNTGLAALKPRGTLVNLAIWPHKPIDFYPMAMTSGEKRITGSMCYTIEDFEGIIDCMAKGKMPIEHLREFITKKVPIEDGVEGGFIDLIKNKDIHIKILISPMTENGEITEEGYIEEQQ
ncbi:2,3-butanediol dehydrogenase [Ascoidea rubescens DSM 1968]|uniref:GroES-like protein n=1 Tax=Ascoidea rubescens DSM 1968 TaxID=1344418 RepID=A0A1D2V9C6_9ASCO|nr:GroES-like protein [Ascoidea rubescens DSM 1968]ODV58169.1 GroES-like protein [Ascoidea rubescens DSM 1968]